MIKIGMFLPYEDMLLIAPIQYEDVITSVILSLHRITENSVGSSRNRREMWVHGFSAQTNFLNLS